MAKATVLLVDDEEDFTATLSKRLVNRGLDVDVSGTGLQALEKVREKSYDAVILDLAMPGMDGIETLKRLLVQRPDLQVILLTGHGSVRKGVEAMQSGAMEFLEKPVDLATLLDKIGAAQTEKMARTEQRVQETLTDLLKRKGW
jgi:two-component system OmpR family response regulator